MNIVYFVRQRREDALVRGNLSVSALAVALVWPSTVRAGQR
jgi:hypothetical protein